MAGTTSAIEPGCWNTLNPTNGFKSWMIAIPQMTVIDDSTMSTVRRVAFAYLSGTTQAPFTARRARTGALNLIRDRSSCNAPSGHAYPQNARPAMSVDASNTTRASTIGTKVGLTPIPRMASKTWLNG